MVGTGILSNNMETPLPNVAWHFRGWPYTMTPSLDQTILQVFTLLLSLILLPKITFYVIVRQANRGRLFIRTRSSCPTFGLACVLMFREKERYLTRSYDNSPYTHRKSKKQHDNTKTPPKTSITQRFRTDFGRSVGVTTATKLVWINRFKGTKRSYILTATDV